MPEDDSHRGPRVGGWVPPYSPDVLSPKPPIRPITPAAFPPAPIPGFPGWAQRGKPLHRRAALAAVALATLGVAAATTVILGDNAARTAPAFVAGTLPAVPPVPPPAEPVIIASAVAIRSSSSPFTTGSAPSSNPATKPSSHRQSTKPTTKPPSPTKAPAVTLRAGSTVALTLADNSGQRVRHRSFIGRIDTIGASSSTLDRADSSFTVRVGLGNSGCSSLESVNYPGYFLRHQNYQIKLQRNDGSDLYRQDATFCAVTIRSGDALALQSTNYPKRFVVASDSRLSLRETSADGALALVPVAVS